MFYILIFVFCLSLIWFLWPMKNAKRQPPKLSGGLPIFGHGLMFFGESTQTYKNLIKISDECLEKGGILTASLGIRPAYCITDPEAFLAVSNACLDKEYVYKFARDFVGEGLVTASVSTWQKHRKILNPAFSQTVLDTFIQCFNNQAKNLVDALASHLGESFEHETVLRQNNLESICLTATGVGGEEYTALQKKYLSLVTKIQLILYERFRQLWFHNDFIFNLSPLKKKQDEFLIPFINLSNKIIQNKKLQMKNMPEQSKTGKLKPFLELILNISNETNCFTDEEIRQETDTIIATGHETTATVLNFALILLGSYPEVQKKVFDEIMEVTGGTDKDFSKDDLSKLVYTEAVLKETLRIYPLVPVVARYLDKEVKLKNYTLNANTSCFLFICGLNRHPAWGPDAEKFRPERWFDTANLPDMNHYGSFSIGKRNCIGKAYAMMSMKITLAHVIRQYKVTGDMSTLKLKWLMVIYPASGNHYSLERREKDSSVKS